MKDSFNNSKRIKSFQCFKTIFTLQKTMSHELHLQIQKAVNGRSQRFDSLIFFR